jgi:hypothetical protein
MNIKFRQRIFNEDLIWTGNFHYFNPCEYGISYLDQHMSINPIFDYDISFGKKDLKGNYIFTNDIVQLLEYDCEGSKNFGKYKVIFDDINYGFALKTIESTIFKEDSIIGIKSNLTIIGNIYKQ